MSTYLATYLDQIPLGYSIVQMQNAGVYLQTTAITGLRFAMSSGNILSGTIRIYGLAK